MFSNDFFKLAAGNEAKVEDAVRFAADLEEGSEVGLIHNLPGAGAISVAMGLAEILDHEELVIIQAQSYSKEVTLQRFEVREGDGGMEARVSMVIETEQDLMQSRSRVEKALEVVKNGSAGMPVFGIILGAPSERATFILQSCCRKVPSHESFLLRADMEARCVAASVVSVYRFSCMPIPEMVLWIGHNRAILSTTPESKGAFFSQCASNVESLRPPPPNPTRMALVFEDRLRAQAVCRLIADQLV